MGYKTYPLSGGGTYKFNINQTGGSELTRFISGTSFPFGVVAHGDSLISGDLDVGKNSGDELRCLGDVIAFSTSDINLKKDIKSITKPLDKIKKLSGNTFTWKSEAGKKKSGKEDIGVIAQEVYKIFPNATREVEGVMSVRYEKLIPLLIECVKDQQIQIDELKLKLEENNG